MPIIADVQRDIVVVDRIVHAPIPARVAIAEICLPLNFPFETSIRPFGIATLISMFSTSSRHWSLFGHQTLAPVSSQAVLIHGCPAESLKSEAAEPARLHGVARIVEIDRVRMAGAQRRLGNR